MSLEVRPLGVKCNIGCHYCYQNPQRLAGNVGVAYDLDRILTSIEQHGGPFTLFGGEPLLLPEADLVRLWEWGFERFQQNGIQTNGALITDRHIDLFRKYRVHVGISIDGPGEQNDARWAGSLERTREATACTEAAIERLCAAGLAPSLIVTLHRLNATAEKRPIMDAWIRHLAAIGVTSLRLHILEVETPAIRAQYALSEQENIDAFLAFAALAEELDSVSIDVFHDLEQLLLGRDDQVTCVWRACDPYTTAAVQGLEGFGQRSNCGRTNKDGIDFVKADAAGFERYVSLYHTPQEHGGCSGCRFFLMCKGQCPGTSIDGDWRNRSEHCGVWKAMFRHAEDRMLDRGIIPVSAQPIRQSLEAEFLNIWQRGGNPTMQDLLDRRFDREVHGKRDERRAPEATAHGDFTDHGDR